MMQNNVVVIPGDGIGKEVIAAALKLLDLLNQAGVVKVKYVMLERDADFYLLNNYILKLEEIETLQSEFSAILFGAIGDERVPDQQHARELLLNLRQKCDFFINFRHLRCLNKKFSPLKSKNASTIDMVVFRENTEGLYTQNGFRLGADSDNSFCVDHMIYTQVKVRKFLQAAFLWAKNNNRKRIDLVDKANAIPNNGRLWREEFDKVSKKYPEIKTRKHYIDAYCCRMVTDPEKIDVVVTSNLFGDILGDLGAGITGGLGLAGSANINPETKFALFEPIHGSAPDIAGQGVANPIACFHSLSLMLSHLEYTVAAKALDSTIEKLVTDPAEEGALTPDLGGQGTTNTLTQRALHLLEKELS